MRRVIDAAGGILLLSLAAPAFAQTTTYGPPAPAPRSAQIPPVVASAPANPETKRKRLPFIGAVSSSGAMQFGLGLFRVPKTNAIDPNRNFPMREIAGRTQRVAAVGGSIRF